MKPVQAVLLLTAMLQVLPLSLLLFIHLSFKISKKSPSEAYPSLSLSSFSALQPLPTRVFSVFLGNFGNAANSRQEHSAQPLWCFHPSSCLVCRGVCLLGWNLRSPGSAVFCLQNTNLGKVSLPWQRPKGVRGVPCGSLCLLLHNPNPGGQGFLEFLCLGCGSCPWGLGLGKPHHHRNWQSSESATKLVVMCGFFACHCVMQTFFLGLGSVWRRKNVLNYLMKCAEILIIK